MKIRGILFDVDGTLVDTREAYREANTHAMTCGLVEVENAQLQEWLEEWIPFGDMLMDLNLSAEVEAVLRSVRRQKLLSILRERSPWIPGAPQLLTTLRTAGTPRALVTAASTTHVNILDEALSLHYYLDIAITRDDVGAFGKPHPRGLQMAADRVQVPHKECLYIGNELNDVRAAKNAGMLACLVETGEKDSDAAGECDEWFASLKEFHNFLRAKRILTP